MKYARSFLLGSSLVFIIVLFSGVIFYFSLGACPDRSFSCDNGDICVPQSRFCDGVTDCKDESDENYYHCGALHGSKDVLERMFLPHIQKLLNNDTRVSIKCSLDDSKVPSRCHCQDYTLIDCSNHSMLREVPPVVESTILFLQGNQITLNSNSFADFNNLLVLNLDKNGIQNLPPGLFSGLKKLKRLYLQGNEITELNPLFLEGLDTLKALFLSNNKIVHLEFPLLPKLEWLDLSGNQLHLNHTKGVFSSLPSIVDLVLKDNLIEVIDQDLFKNLPYLQLLSLRNNKITTINEGAFDHLINLKELDLSENLLIALPQNLLHPLNNLTSMDLSNNSLPIKADTFPEVSSLKSLELDGIEKKNIDFTAIQKLSNLKTVLFRKFHYCSLVPNVPRCIPNTDGVSDLKDLLSRPALRVSTWMVAVFTLAGNLLVLWGRGTSRDENRALSLLIRNLAVADMLMGVYLLVIGIQDARYRNYYHQYISKWTSSWLCITIGAIAMVSSEVSMLILAFMSVERFLLIVNPLGGYARLNPKAARRSLFFVWTIGIMLAIIPIIHWRNSTAFYGTYSGMCFPLHLREKYALGWQYSAFIFLGVNLIGLLVIASVYCGMFISVWRTRRAAPPSTADCEFAVRFFFIVFTDAACWAPIICFKILNFLDIEISGHTYAWLVVFVLPLNSAVNPLLYTFTTPKYRDQLLSFSWRYSANRSSNGDTESSRTSSNKNIVCTIVGNNKNTTGETPKLQNTLTEPLVSTINSTYSLDCRL